MLGVRVPPGLKNKRAFAVLDKLKKYVKETVAELRKMTWPTKDELIGSTIVVVVVSSILALFIGIVDRVLLWAVQTIFGTGVGS